VRNRPVLDREASHERWWFREIRLQAMVIAILTAMVVLVAFTAGYMLRVSQSGGLSTALAARSTPETGTGRRQ